MQASRLLAAALAIALAGAPAAAAGLVEDLQRQTETVHYAVGMDAVPRDMEPGDEYKNGEVVHVDHVLHFIRVKTDEPAVFEVRAKSDDDVRYVETDPVRSMTTYDPNDEYEDSYQYATEQIDAEGAWDTALSGSGSNVCVIDTGVRYTHEDIDDNYVDGTDLVNDDDDPWDDNGHGTHTSGTAAAGLDNTDGVSGMGNVGLYHVKALNSNGGGRLSDISSAIRWCSDNVDGNVVTSMSLGTSSGSSTLEDAVEYAYGNGDLLVAAAGNDGPCSDCVNYPAAYSEVVAVTCTDDNEDQCSFSSQGPEAELAAPGKDIPSTWNDHDSDYKLEDGTSMSAPHVAGMATLIWTQDTSTSRDSLRNTLQDTAQDLGSSGRDNVYGYGELEAGAAMDQVVGGGGGGGGGSEQVYFENFTDTDWTKSDGSTDLWRLGSECLGVTSSPNSLQFNNGDDDCDYVTGSGAEGWAQSEVIDLSSYSSATLTFEHAWETESYDGGAYDVMRAQVSSDGGSSWTTIDSWDSRDANRLSFDSDSYDVSDYTTSDFRIRMTFDTKDANYNNYQGWHVDDVEVTAS